MACATTQIRIGTTATPLPRRRPWKVAQEAVTLDHLSRGRMILGVGLGNGDDVDFAGLGEQRDPRVRAEMLDEALQIVARVWSGEPFAFEGSHYQVAEHTFLPRPVQSPRIPIWVGGSSRRKGPVQRAARWDGMVPIPDTIPGGESIYLSPEHVREAGSSHG
jgi:alkanesulfonate monooxygenase SsuD/methylene tetrahydromethanopterin reductase-like flavin-dependent oxidoreductase (luciferase family)